MTEHEQQREVHNQFPKISKELIDRFVKEVHSGLVSQKIKERDVLRTEIEKEEPVLLAAIESVAGAYENSIRPISNTT